MDSGIRAFLLAAVKAGSQVDLRLTTGDLFEGVVVTDVDGGACEILSDGRLYVVVIERIVWAVLT